MEREYPVPGFDKYTVTADGKVYSYYGKGGAKRQLTEHRVMKRHSKTRVYIYYALQVPGTRKKKHISLPRLLLASKLGRWLEDWEQARHKDGDCNNNHMDNLLPGCVVNNMIDDLENGSRSTNLENIEIAIARLEALKDRYGK